jgi:hypothetical protein
VKRECKVYRFSAYAHLHASSLRSRVSLRWSGLSAWFGNARLRRYRWILGLLLRGRHFIGLPLSAASLGFHFSLRQLLKVPRRAADHFRVKLVPAITLVLIANAAFAQEPAKLIFYRSVNSAPGGMYYIRGTVRIDNEKPVHKVGSNAYWVTQSHPGLNVIYGDRKETAKAFTFEAGQSYYFRLDLVWKSPLTLSGRANYFRIVNVPPDVATGELTGLREEK